MGESKGNIMIFSKKITLFALLGLTSIANAGPGLADGAAKFVGNITTRGQVRSDFGTYWNQITAENECKWASIQGNRNQFNWSGCDAAYNWAKNNGVPSIRIGSTLLALKKQKMQLKPGLTLSPSAIPTLK